MLIRRIVNRLWQKTSVTSMLASMRYSQKRYTRLTIKVKIIEDEEKGEGKHSQCYDWGESPLEVLKKQAEGKFQQELQEGSRDAPSCGRTQSNLRGQFGLIQQKTQLRVTRYLSQATYSTVEIPMQWSHQCAVRDEMYSTHTHQSSHK